MMPKHVVGEGNAGGSEEAVVRTGRLCGAEGVRPVYAAAFEVSSNHGNVKKRLLCWMLFVVFLLIVMLAGLIPSRSARAQESSNFSGAQLLLSDPQANVSRPRSAQSGDDTFVVWRQTNGVFVNKIGNKGTEVGRKVELTRGTGWAEDEAEIAVSGQNV